MAVSDAIVRLNDYCELQFIQTDVNTSPVPLDANFYTITNKSTSTIQVYNQNGDAEYTNNIEDYLSILYSNNRLYKYDPDTTPTIFSYNSNLAKSSLISDSVVYDRIRFHFKSGFSFSTFTGGLTLSVKARLNNNNFATLASIVLDARTAYDLIELNTEPLTLGQFRYDKYVEIAFPSLKYINNEYYSTADSLKSNTLGYNISGGSGFIKDGSIFFSVDECSSDSPILNGSALYETMAATKHYEAAVKSYSEYDNLGVIIRESSVGDYLEYFLSYDGGFCADFLGQLKLQNPNASYTIIHQLTIYEQLGTSSFIETDKYNIYQTDNFDSPKKIVPILEYADRAVSFSVDYTATLYNENDGSQVIKQGSFTFNNVKKYGKKRMTISLDENIQIYKIYNKIFKSKEDNIELFASQEFVADREVRNSGTIEYKEVQVKQPYFIDYNMISVSDVNLNSKEYDLTKNLIFKQGDLRLFVKPFDNMYKIKVYENQDGYLKHKSLSSIDTYNLVFVDGAKKMVVSNVVDDNIGVMSAGDLVFKLLESDAMKVLGYSNRSFSITCNNTEMYRGEWLMNSETSLYNAHIKSVKAEQQTDIQNAKAIQDLQDSADNATIGTDVYVAGYVGQAKNGSEVSASKGIFPKS